MGLYISLTDFLHCRWTRSRPFNVLAWPISWVSILPILILTPLTKPRVSLSSSYLNSIDYFPGSHRIAHCSSHRIIPQNRSLPFRLTISSTGVFYSLGLTDGRSLATALGPNITITVQDGDTYINDAKIIATDFLLSTGVMHVIDRYVFPTAYLQNKTHFL